MKTRSRVHRYGQDAVLIDTDSGSAHHVAAELRLLLGEQILDVVPTSEHLLVTFHRAPDMTQVLKALGRVRPLPADSSDSCDIVIPVEFDGQDLPLIAQKLGTSERDVVEMHTRATYRVEFFGFAPGFAYLRGLPPPLHLPRLPTPRVRVPAGTVAIAAGYCAVYPRESPGGWWQLGHTDADLFDLGRQPPSLLQPGAQVRFTEEPQTGTHTTLASDDEP